MERGDIMGNQEVKILQPSQQILPDLAAQGGESGRNITQIELGLYFQDIRVAGVQAR